jgi:hypothetical protein
MWAAIHTHLKISIEILISEAFSIETTIIEWAINNSCEKAFLCLIYEKKPIYITKREIMGISCLK